jgi:putative membrane protein
MLTTLATAAVAHAGPWAAGWGWAFFLIPVFWILVIGLVVFLVTRRRRDWAAATGGAYGPPWARAASAESTLAERFAQGDIDETEYRARLEVLRANRPNGWAVAGRMPRHPPRPVPGELRRARVRARRPGAGARPSRTRRRPSPVTAPR